MYIYKLYFMYTLQKCACFRHGTYIRSKVKESKGKQVFFKDKFKFATAVDLNK